MTCLREWDSYWEFNPKEYILRAKEMYRQGDGLTAELEKEIEKLGRAAHLNSAEKRLKFLKSAEYDPSASLLPALEIERCRYNPNPRDRR